ncbi:hypothetical protein VTJ04DRAFT_1179 [Mycothermus thermophilus]|uniref:uncharacterized protein n=1 Tax=Humicola insolens TaxID=85995 RepID=UPI0037428F7C
MGNIRSWGVLETTDERASRPSSTGRVSEYDMLTNTCIKDFIVAQPRYTPQRNLGSQHHFGGWRIQACRIMLLIVLHILPRRYLMVAGQEHT